MIHKKNWCTEVMNNGYGNFRPYLGSNIHLLYSDNEIEQKYQPRISDKTTYELFVIGMYCGIFAKIDNGGKDMKKK